jgi:hypothetical protein
VAENIAEELRVNHEIPNPKFRPGPTPGGEPILLTYTRIDLTADPPHLVVGGAGGNGRITVAGKDGEPVAELIAGDKEAVIAAGQKGSRPGRLTLYDGTGQPALNVSTDAILGTLGLMVGVYQPTGGRPGWIALRNQAGKDSIYLDGKEGRISARDSNGKETLLVDGAGGDIVFQNADCAEEFDFACGDDVEAGTVVVIDAQGRLRPSEKPYDRKVAGIVSGAGDCRPALLLDRKSEGQKRLPVALVGKVYCKVDACLAKIEVGDLLTTSATPGHAMKASDPLRAFGSVLGKALRPLESGTGLIPVLVALQ